jgi:hypothetical protein
VGAAATLTYRTPTSTVKQQAIATTSFANAELTAVAYAFVHTSDTLRKTARVYVATTSRDVLSTVEGGHKVGCGRGVGHKIAEAVLEMENIGHRMKVFFGPGEKDFAEYQKRTRPRNQSLKTAAKLEWLRPRGCASCRMCCAWSRQSGLGTCARMRKMCACSTPRRS